MIIIEMTIAVALLTSGTMPISMLPSTCVLLLACISYGVLLQSVEGAPSILTTVQREDRLNVLLQMLDAKLKNEMAGIQCNEGTNALYTFGIRLCPQPFNFDEWKPANQLPSSKLKSSIQNLLGAKQKQMNIEEAGTEQLCMCFRSPCPCDKWKQGKKKRISNQTTQSVKEQQ